MNITWQELLHLKNPNIIDIRTKEQYNLGHIQKAKNINSSALLANTESYLNKNEQYYIYCNTGTTSTKICQILASRGYKTVNILGGYKAWNSLK